MGLYSSILLALVVIVGPFGLLIWLANRPAQSLWKGETPQADPLVFVNTRMGVRPTVLGHDVPEPYRLACLFWGSGLIDRTQTLDTGFPYAVRDPLPTVSSADVMYWGDPARDRPDAEARMLRALSDLCDARGREIVGEARRTNRKIQLLWSGGIDSTAAAVAIFKALRADNPDDRNLLQIVGTHESKREYRKFFRQYVKKRGRWNQTQAVAKELKSTELIVTGEHGDQLIGSDKALGLSQAQRDAPWREGLDAMLRAQLASPERAEAVMAYLEPQIAKAPVTVVTLFDVLWWLNFSLKWQAVSYRLPAAVQPRDVPDIVATTRHFFRTAGFEAWALAHPGVRQFDAWTRYKWPLKAYIAEFTGDRDYERRKEKEPSLRGNVGSAANKLAVAVTMGHAAYYEREDLSLKAPLGMDGGADSIGDRGNGASISLSFSVERETPLWDDVGDGE